MKLVTRRVEHLRTWEFLVLLNLEPGGAEYNLVWSPPFIGKNSSSVFWGGLFTLGLGIFTARWAWTPSGVEYYICLVAHFLVKIVPLSLMWPFHLFPCVYTSCSWRLLEVTLYWHILLLLHKHNFYCSFFYQHVCCHLTSFYPYGKLDTEFECMSMRSTKENKRIWACIHLYCPFICLLNESSVGSSDIYDWMFPCCVRQSRLSVLLWLSLGEN